MNDRAVVEFLHSPAYVSDDLSSPLLTILTLVPPLAVDTAFGEVLEHEIDIVGVAKDVVQSYYVLMLDVKVNFDLAEYHVLQIHRPYLRFADDLHGEQHPQSDMLHQVHLCAPTPADILDKHEVLQPASVCHTKT